MNCHTHTHTHTHVQLLKRTRTRARTQTQLHNHRHTTTHTHISHAQLLQNAARADLVELMAGAGEQGSLVPVLGRSVKEECEANTRRGGQTVGSRFSQQVRGCLGGVSWHEGPWVPVLGRSVKEECEAHTRRGGQTVGSRFSQQVRGCSGGVSWHEGPWVPVLGRSVTGERSRCAGEGAGIYQAWTDVGAGEGAGIYRAWTNVGIRQQRPAQTVCVLGACAAVSHLVPWLWGFMQAPGWCNWY